jgi:hypothetical protein
VAATRWTVRRDVVDGLRKRWDRGEFLISLAEGRPVVPQSVSLRGPSAREVADRFGEVQDWVRRWEGDGSGLRLEYAAVGGRLIGSNQVPRRAWVDEEARLWRLIGVEADVAAFRELLAVTRQACPALAPWVREHPRTALAEAAAWPRLLAVAGWIADRGGPQVYLRQVDVAGVDTKFVEVHRGVLGELLEVLLPPERVTWSAPRSRFAERYGMAVKPAYLRCRRLDGAGLLRAPGPAELTLRVEEAATIAPAGRRVVILENEITYLALPAIPDTLAVLGGGYGIGALQALTWLPEREVHYWGDLDTHGFAILDRLRAFLPSARSLLMDRTTLEGHQEHWGREPAPTTAVLDHLTPSEQLLYADLIEDRYGPALRLEQERVRFGAVRHALAELSQR